MSDILGAIAGTAVYEKVRIEVQNSRYKITGEYQASEVTYNIPHGCLQIERMDVELEQDSVLIPNRGQCKYYSGEPNIGPFTLQRTI
jgi:hypothetical protein